jgi:hypothetical protein
MDLEVQRGSMDKSKQVHIRRGFIYTHHNERRSAVCSHRLERTQEWSIRRDTMEKDRSVAHACRTLKLLLLKQELENFSCRTGCFVAAIITPRGDHAELGEMPLTVQRCD